jgi:hypothetical protein
MEGQTSCRGRNLFRRRFMYLVAGNVEYLADLVRERVEARCAHEEWPCDVDAVIGYVLSEPEIAALLETVWDDESGKLIYSAVVDDVRQQVKRCLQEFQHVRQ